MRRLLIACAAMLTIVAPTPANPFSRTWHYMGHHKRFFIMEGVAVGAAGLHAYGLHHCRRVNGVEPCDEHYGAAWGFYGFITAINVVAMPAVAESCWKGGGGKFCYALAYSGPAYQAGHGIYEWRVDRREHEIEPRAPAPSLLRLRF